MSVRHRFRAWVRYLRALGVPQGLRLIALECTRTAIQAVEIRSSQLPHPVTVRLHTTDTEAFDGVIRKREYELALATPPSVIVDVGANIGLSAIWFASRFPDARVFALEPEPSNYELLCRNAAPYPGIIPIRAALWSESGTIGLVDSGTGHWGFRTVADVTPVTGVEAISLPDLQKRYGIDCIDLLKIDIEGAEREVFLNGEAWIGHVQVIAAELHDHLAPGATRAFEAATAEFPVRWRRGENHFVARPGRILA